MSAIRLLLVDDSVTVRRVLAQLLGSERDIEVVGTAPDGETAMTRLRLLDPDALVLDVAMPPPDGLDLLRRIRAERPHLPVVMFSALTQRGATTAIEALSLGASDYVAKPTGEDGAAASAAAVVREQLAPRLRALCARHAARTRTPCPPAAARPQPQQHPPRESRRPPLNARPSVVAIAASTGGPPVLQELVCALPAGYPLPVLIVQHMPPAFTGPFAARLASLAAVRVAEAVDGAVARPGEVWIAPGGRHLAVRSERGAPRLALTSDPPEHSCRPAADVLFRSLAATQGRAALGIVLTGMGQDGLAGAQAIRAAGGTLWIQDRESSVVWGMPGFVQRAGVADWCAAPAHLAEGLLALAAADARR